jgi:hypothetical protein
MPKVSEIYQFLVLVDPIAVAWRLRWDPPRLTAGASENEVFVVEIGGQDALKDEDSRAVVDFHVAANLR